MGIFPLCIQVKAIRAFHQPPPSSAGKLRKFSGAGAEIATATGSRISKELRIRYFRDFSKLALTCCSISALNLPLHLFHKSFVVLFLLLACCYGENVFLFLLLFSRHGGHLIERRPVCFFFEFRMSHELCILEKLVYRKVKKIKPKFV